MKMFADEYSVYGMRSRHPECPYHGKCVAQKRSFHIFSSRQRQVLCFKVRFFSQSCKGGEITSTFNPAQKNCAASTDYSSEYAVYVSHMQA